MKRISGTAITQTFLFVLALAVIILTRPAFADINPFADFNPQAAGTVLSLDISSDAAISIRGARVQQIMGSTFFVRMVWGRAVIVWIVKTDGKTVVSRRYGGITDVSEIAVGDYVDINGIFAGVSDSLSVVATTVKDYSLQKEPGQFSGTVSSVSSAGDSFNLLLPGNATISVVVGTTTTITKGTLALPPTRLVPGDKILSTAGTYDYVSKTLAATNIVVYQNKGILTPRNFEGKIKSISAQTPPTTIVVTVGSKDYTVVLSSNTKVLNKKRQPIVLSRFVVGDKVRFYGAIQEDLDLQTVDKVELIRNLEL